MDINLAESGDLILFKDNTYLSNFLELFVDRGYVDGGVVIRDPIYDTNKLYVLITRGYKDKQFDIELIKLDELRDDRMIYIRKLNCTRDIHFHNRLYQAYCILKNPRENLSRFHWMKEQYDAYSLTAANTSFPWCGMITYILVCIGLLPVYFDWAGVIPDIFNDSFNLQDGILQPPRLILPAATGDL